MFQPVTRHFKKAANTNKITAWKSKGLSEESIKPPSMSDNSLNAGINYIDTAKIRVKLDESCFKQDKVSFTNKQVRSIYIFYEINLSPFNVGKDFASGNYLFGAVKLTKNDNDFDKYKYNVYGIGFDVRGKDAYLMIVGLVKM